MPSPLAPYLPYIDEYSPYLTVYSDHISCGEISDMLEEIDGVHHGCDACKWSTSDSTCLFTSDDPLYSIFQIYLRTNHPELFL